MRSNCAEIRILAINSLEMACQVQLQSDSPPLFRRVSYSSLSSCGGESLLFVSCVHCSFSVVVSLAATVSAHAARPFVKAFPLYPLAGGEGGHGRPTVGPDCRVSGPKDGRSEEQRRAPCGGS